MRRTRHRNGGLRKRCGCPRKVWPKCAHSWHFNYKPRGGVHHQLCLDRVLRRHIDSKSEAETEAARIRIAIDEGTFRTAGSQPSEVIPVETFEWYARDRLRTATPNLKASTIRFYSINLDTYAFPLIGSRPIQEVSRRDCPDVIATLRERGLKVNSVRGIVRTISVVLSQAVEDEHLPANPALKLGKYLRRGDEATPQIDPFTREEVTHLLSVTAEHFADWHVWMLAGFRTGLRLGELLALQWGDIDWRGRYILVRQNIVQGTITTPKNHQQRRVDLSPELRAYLRLWRRRLSADWLKDGLPRPEWVFPSREGTPRDDCNTRRSFRAILEKADLHQRGPHQMRHTFASLLIQAGEPVTYVSAQLGHRDSAHAAGCTRIGCLTALRGKASIDSTNSLPPVVPLYTRWTRQRDPTYARRPDR